MTTPRGAPSAGRSERLQVARLVAELVGEAAQVPALDPVERLRVRIEQDDLRVEAEATRRFVGAVHAISVALPDLDPGT